LKNIIIKIKSIKYKYNVYVNIMSEVKYNLSNIQHYNKYLQSEERDIYYSKYFELINNYLNYVCNHLYINESNYICFIISKGISVIHNIFHSLLFYTKNLDLTFYHCQKSYSYLIEFVTQMNSENLQGLELTFNDAILFIYRKTIFEIDTKFKTTYTINDKEVLFFKTLYELTQQYNILYHNYFTFYNKNNIQFNKENIFLLHNNISKIIKKNIYNELTYELLKNVNCLFTYINVYINNIEDITQILVCYCNKIIKYNMVIQDIETILQNKDIETYIKNDFTPLKFINYIFT
jgi:hypothetical protein